MNVYAWTSPPIAAVEISGYTHKGCFSDSQNRVLAAYSFTNSKMTIKMCLDTCKSKSYSIAGVESYVPLYSCGKMTDEIVGINAIARMSRMLL